MPVAGPPLVLGQPREGALGTDAEVTFVTDGTFRIYVRSVDPRDHGGFVIVAAPAPEAAPARPRD